MEFLSIIVLGLMIALLIAISILIPAMIVFNIKAGEKYRENLAEQLSQLRINRMLGALGIDVNRYLHQQHVHEIHQHMNRCESCENTDQCDQELNNNQVDPANIAYCNNDEALNKIVSKQEQAPVLVEPK